MADFSKVKAVGQHDKFSCWAACLSWWLKAMKLTDKKRVVMSQTQLIAEFNRYADKDGGVSYFTFLNTIGMDSRFRLESRGITSNKLEELDIKEPTFIIYEYPEVGGTHMNVLFDYTLGETSPGQYGRRMACMEPFYPIGADDGKRTGMILTRPVSHFFTNSAQVKLAKAKI